MKIIAIGRNYIDHAKELNNPVPVEPIFFLKPETTLVRNNQPFFYPDFSNDIQYEVEIVIKFNKVGKNIAPKFAHRYYSEIAIGIDFTARDLQNKCKEKGLPWEISKAFDGAAPISKFLQLESIADFNNLSFRLELNGQIVQEGNTSQMIFHVDQLIAHVSKFMTIKIGDLMFTGTPAGVGPVKIGDRLTAFIEDKKMLDFQIK
ncbi:MAG: 2-hydroxyhepta-2,4-diene-1,7-dioate isomerase [Bacteroidetes bacterium GWF2_33_16]|nr:MAG: 2-hydroxyhepta-2,4-diene-1,7-dioate isomerase [Bacteroidetes bacterium GWE2_32_14]OFY06467.1 MAG: 2-hydroxyhepta-2,4-diene-1,7-dioate isomerase [Bacteroidetes bacterium GWF2_33_16]